MVAAPLTELIKQTVEWKRNSAEQSAFEKLIKPAQPTFPIVLLVPDQSLPFPSPYRCARHDSGVQFYLTPDLGA